MSIPTGVVTCRHGPPPTPARPRRHPVRGCARGHVELRLRRRRAGRSRGSGSPDAARVAVRAARPVPGHARPVAAYAVAVLAGVAATDRPRRALPGGVPAVRLRGRHPGRPGRYGGPDRRAPAVADRDRGRLAPRGAHDARMWFGMLLGLGRGRRRGVGRPRHHRRTAVGLRAARGRDAVPGRRDGPRTPAAAAGEPARDDHDAGGGHRRRADDARGGLRRGHSPDVGRVLAGGAVVDRAVQPGWLRDVRLRRPPRAARRSSARCCSSPHRPRCCGST